VAWLHEVLESSSVTEEELLADGLTDDELRALWLLTRPKNCRSDKDYFGHIGHIARASGSAGEMARTVKRLDLADRLRHPNRRADGWHPPYQAALALFEEDSSQPKTEPRSAPRRPVANPLDEGHTSSLKALTVVKSSLLSTSVSAGVSLRSRLT
jgi:hypothetical protein